MENLSKVGTRTKRNGKCAQIKDFLRPQSLIVSLRNALLYQFDSFNMSVMPYIMPHTKQLS